jgi:hypothetical protein
MEYWTARIATRSVAGGSVGVLRQVGIAPRVRGVGVARKQLTFNDYIVRYAENCRGCSITPTFSRCGDVRKRVVNVACLRTRWARLGRPPDLAKRWIDPTPTPSRKRLGYSGASPHRPNYTVTTILPICSFDSMYRWASTISSSLNVFAMMGLSTLEDNPSVTNFRARGERS